MHSQNTSRLESLSNEVLWDIFEYLDAHNLYQAFYGLNGRINTILRLAQVSVVYDSLNDIKSDLSTVLQLARPSQIRNLYCYNGINIKRDLFSTIYEYLHLISLHNMDYESVNTMFQYIPVNNHIKCLSIKERRLYSNPKSSVCHLVFVTYAHKFASLVNLSWEISSHITTFPIVSAQFPKLRRLSIDAHNWTREFLKFLQNNVPNLKSLRFIGSSIYVDVSTGMELKQIRELDMVYPCSFYHLKSILSNFPCLNRLRIDQQYVRHYESMTGTQWRQIIESLLPNLKQLTIDFGNGTADHIVETFYVDEFWASKKLKVTMILDKSKHRFPVVKTISFGKPWHFKYFDKFNL